MPTPTKRATKKRTRKPIKRAAKKRAPARKPQPKRDTTQLAITKDIGRYLNTLDTGAMNRGHVTLGRLPGFPQSTTDPLTVDRAIHELETRALTDPSPIKRLKLHQRVISLRAASEALKAAQNGGGPRDTFIAHGAAWAAHNHVSYAAFRQAGVPATDLKEAGITR